VQYESKNYASLRVEGEEGLVLVAVSSRKPAIPVNILGKWQRIVDLVASIIRVPSGLITRFTEENLEVVVASLAQGNPYKRDDSDKLGIGMFCETVVGKKAPLLVKDTASSEYWASNPHAGLGMHSYIGVPIQWEDGELFGSFCMLTDRANSIESAFLDLMRQFKEIIETDLKYLLLYAELEERLSAKDMELREMHHRIKNQFNMLISYINLQAFAAPEGGAKEALKEVQHRILAVSMIHEELYSTVAGSAMSLDVYLPRLCGYILEDMIKGDFRVEYSIDRIVLPMEQEISIAMILSELLTNSAKYAARGAGSVRIGIRVGRENDGSLAIVYRDDGIGMTLIDALTRQLNGSMKAENDGGAKFSFRLRP
jgi:two-component sensor histidine kinase